MGYQSGGRCADVNTNTQAKVPHIGGSGQRQDTAIPYADGGSTRGAGANEVGKGSIPAQDSDSSASAFGPESYGGAVNKGASGEGHTALPDVHSPFITTKRGGGASTPSNLPVVPLS